MNLRDVLLTQFAIQILRSKPPFLLQWGPWIYTRFTPLHFRPCFHPLKVVILTQIIAGIVHFEVKDNSHFMDIGHFPTLTWWKWPGNKSTQSQKMTPQERQYKIPLTANTKSVLKTDTVLQTWPDLHWGLGRRQRYLSGPVIPACDDACDDKLRPYHSYWLYYKWN